MPEPYEDLVKEYLELKGFFVRQNVIFGSKFRREVDLLALSLKPPEVLVAEVSANYPNRGVIDDMKSTLTSDELSRYVQDNVGRAPTKKMIFYWLNPRATRQRKRIENQVGSDIEAVSLQRVAKWLKRQTVNRGVVYSRAEPYSTVFQLL